MCSSDLKHADRDAGASMRFRPVLVEGILADAVFMYHRVTSHYFPEAVVYIMYFFTVYEGELGDHPLAVALRKRWTEIEEPPRTRRDFFSILRGRLGASDTVDTRGPKGGGR